MIEISSLFSFEWFYFLYLECKSSFKFTVFNADFSHLFFANKKLQKCILFPFQMLNDIFNYVDVVLFHWVKFVFSFTKKFHYFIGIYVNPFCNVLYLYHVICLFERSLYVLQVSIFPLFYDFDWILDVFWQFFCFSYYRICITIRPNMGGCHGRDRMLVGFTTTYAISAYHH